MNWFGWAVGWNVIGFLSLLYVLWRVSDINTFARTTITRVVTEPHWNNTQTELS